MSLYALPGLLFPPVEFPGCPKKSSDSSSQLGTNNAKALPTQVVLDPFHALKDFAPHETAAKEMYHDVQKAAVKRGNDDEGRTMISVKEVKIDMERLVKSLTQVKSSFQRETTCTPGQPALLLALNHTSSLGYACLPHEDAVEFVLSISFNGRKYSATRTMQRIFQLRKSLQEECQNHKQWILQKQHRRRQLCSTNTGKHQWKEVAEIGRCNVEDDSPVDDYNITIPQLPSLDSSSSADGSFVQGFGNLQTLLKSYRPDIEGWLRAVMDIVPHDSPVLTQFLWEPLAGGCADTPYHHRQASKTRATTQLSSIEECDHETNEDVTNEANTNSWTNGQQNEDDETAATDTSDDINSFF